MFHFPSVKGLEDVSEKLNEVVADSLFSALLHFFSLRAIESEDEARKAERVLEYLNRAFEHTPPQDVEHYCEVLSILISVFDDKNYIRAAAALKPHEFLKALLQEDGLNQKELVPDHFKPILPSSSSGEKLQDGAQDSTIERKANLDVSLPTSDGSNIDSSLAFVPQEIGDKVGFESASQLSEFLHQRKGHKTLSYSQAVSLGRRFRVDPVNFLVS